MKDFINVGLLGAGTVGGGVIKVLEKNAADIEKKVGKPIRITKVLDRNVEKRRAEYGEQYFFTNKIEDILDDPDIDIVVELLGREHPAKEYIVAAFEKGKNVVTANKDVIAHYGEGIYTLAEQKGLDFMFEASVCGGIPIIEPLKTSMAGNQIHSVMGIVNGTTNYMLSKMSNEHLDYDEVLKEAQAKGYAESDPTADVGGLDAARKVVILASIAFNTRISLKDVLVEGIENIEACDIKYAQNLGYAVKLLGIIDADDVCQSLEYKYLLNYFKALDIHPEADQLVVSDDTSDEIHDETYDAVSSNYYDFANAREEYREIANYRGEHYPFDRTFIDLQYPFFGCCVFNKEEYYDFFYGLVLGFNDKELSNRYTNIILHCLDNENFTAYNLALAFKCCKAVNDYSFILDICNKRIKMDMDDLAVKSSASSDNILSYFYYREKVLRALGEDILADKDKDIYMKYAKEMSIKESELQGGSIWRLNVMYE